MEDENSLELALKIMATIILLTGFTLGSLLTWLLVR